MGYDDGRNIAGCPYPVPVRSVDMTNPSPKRNPLFELEMETLEEGREWTRRRLEQKLQKRAAAEGRLSPPEGGPGADEPSLPDAAHPDHRR